MAYLPEVRPTWFFAVPRIWEKLKAGLEAMMAGLEDEEQKQKMQGALELALKKVRAEQAGEDLPGDLREAYERADAELFSNVRAMLGLDQLESCNVGAAPTPRERSEE